MNWLALDVGGANIKLADGQRYAESHPFPLWRDSHRLASRLRTAIAEAPDADHLAVTMTGELADCFASKAEGVSFILKGLDEASDGRHTRVYLHDGRMVTPQVALHRPLLAASSNWHALASFCGRFAPSGSALLVDVGSTTVDLIPMCDGKPACAGHTDTERLLSGELIYTGIERSPVCALVSSVPYREQQCPVAQELFATTRDVYLLLGDLPEQPDDHHTADHGPATTRAACRRLGRMISVGDETEFGIGEARQAAQHIAQSQLTLIRTAALKVLGRMARRPEIAILSGHGEFLARRVLDASRWGGSIVSLREELGPEISRCATAHGLAVIAREAGG